MLIENHWKNKSGSVKRCMTEKMWPRIYKLSACAHIYFIKRWH